ncbi:MAG: DUF3300 domain-containing protein [Opitutaceae bacterium]|nr:DUF3300 domain-containing protein [Opitutaceae bacterium]
MKRLPLLITAALLGVPLAAQTAADSAPAAATVPLSALRSAEELEQLLAPIALYPDALIALILPASTAPTDIVLAARQLRETPGDRSQIEHRAWDESVKSLTHYLEVLQWLDENLQWTRQVGEAFAQQPADVMQAIQRLRARARAAGTLVDTPQQQVISETEVIRIVPAQPDVIYVPHYAPDVVFYERPAFYPRPFLTFGLGVAVGSWLAYDCDWRRNTVWVGNRHRPWVAHDWRRPVVPIAPYRPTPSYRPPPDVRQWRPPPSYRPGVIAGPRFRSEVTRPTPIGITPVTTPRPAPARPPTPAFTDRGRRPAPTAPAVVPPLAPGFTAPPRSERVGPRPPASFARPPTPAPEATVPSVTMPNIQPLPGARRPERNPDRPASNDGDANRGRNFRGPRDTGAPTASPALPTVPPLRMATPAPTGPVTGPVAPRSYSRSQPPAPPPAATTTETPAPATRPAPPPQGGESRGHRGGGNRSEGWNRER